MEDIKQVFTACRFTSGNLLFPVQIEVTEERVTRIKPRIFGSNEVSISISKVASVNIQTGLIWSTIRIDSTGGSNPITSSGHRKADARAIRDRIERFQAEAFGGSGLSNAPCYRAQKEDQVLKFGSLCCK